MKVYHYSRETGEYTGMSEAQPNPLEPGQFLIPAFATIEEPPSPDKGETVIHDGKWKSVADQRGKKYWHKETKEEYVNQEIQFTPPDELTDIEPPDDAYACWDGKNWKIDEDKKQADEEKIQEDETKAAFMDELPEAMKSILERLDELAERIDNLEDDKIKFEERFNKLVHRLGTDV